MAKIDELLNELCPDGVEFKKLQEVASVMRGASPRPIKNFLSDKNDGIPWIKIGDADPKDKYIFSTAEFINKQGADKSRFLKKGSFILSNSMSFGRPYILAIDGCIHDGWIAISNYESHINSDYMYYVLRTANVKKYWSMSANNGAVSNLNADIVRDTIIPIPPLSIQQEIVEVLDTFTDAISNLEEELALREKQFEYYREQLLSFEKEVVDWKSIGELGQIIRGNGLQKKDFVQEGVGCIHYGQIYTKFGLSTSYTLSFVDAKLADKLTKIDPGNLVIACTSENVDDLCKSVVWLGNTTIVTGGHACVLKHKENAKYIGYCFTSSSFQSQKKKFAYGTKVLDIKKEKLGEIKIPVPSLERQQDIVEILDTFEAMIANIKEEIALRTKQYEYYREKLLSFGK